MVTKALIPFLGATLLFGCASPKKANLESSNPEQAIQEVQTLANQLIQTNSDVLAKEEFEEGAEDLKRARSDLSNNESKKEVMSQLAQAKAHFLDTKKIAREKKIVPLRVLAARNKAVNSGAYSSLHKDLARVDDSLRNETSVFTTDLSASQLSEFQNKYLDLEVRAVQEARVGHFRDIVSKAEENGAEDLAPNTLKTARSDLKMAENLIRQSPRDSSQYSQSVTKANKSAKLLSDVMEKLLGEAKGSSENVALKLVHQERKLGKLSEEVENLQGSLGDTEFALGSASQALVNKEAEIISATDKIKFQKAMNQVRTTFNENEASVYQQGEQLIIRIKKIDFESGKANIPSSAMPLLSKISSIVNELDPQKVMIEGHTDATGKEDYNMLLSNKRAEAVKTYFSSLGVGYPVDARGFGESKPIANNQTKEGRLLNRRVDIVVTATQ